MSHEKGSRVSELLDICPSYLGPHIFDHTQSQRDPAVKQKVVIITCHLLLSSSKLHLMGTGCDKNFPHLMFLEKQLLPVFLEACFGVCLLFK